MEVTRRDLLRATSLAAMTPLFAGPAQAAGASAPAAPVKLAGRPAPKQQDPPQDPPGERIGYAVFGLGQFAVNQILPAFAAARSSKLVALVSGDPDKAARIGKQYGVSKFYDYKNFDDLRTDPAVQIVYVITPNALHADLVVRAAAAGKHVLCEKPLATTSAECERMIAACKTAGRKLMTAYRSRYEPFNEEAIRIVRAGELGKVVSIIADHGRSIDPSNPADRWRLQKALSGGGPLPDIGIYSLNACRYLTGEEPTEVSAMLVQPKDDPKFAEVEQAVHWTMRFPSGVLANCSTSYDWQETKRYRVIGQRGWLDLDPATDYYRHTMRLEHKPTNPGGDLKAVREDRPLREHSQFARMLDHFADCVHHGRDPRTPGEEGLRDVRLIEKIYEAARSGRTLKL